MNVKEYQEKYVPSDFCIDENRKAKCKNKKCKWKGITGDMIVKNIGGWTAYACPVCDKGVEY